MSHSPHRPFGKAASATRDRPEGTAKAKGAGRNKGRPEDEQRNAGIATMLEAGKPWAQIQGAFGCSRDTIARVRRRTGATTAAEA